MGWELPWEWFWVILSAFLIVGEIFTAGFFILPFGIGAAVAAALAFMGGGLLWQWAVFIVVSIALLLPLKRFADRITPDSGVGLAADRVIGKVIFAATGVRVVRPWQKGVVERLGRYLRTAESGITLIIPLLDGMSKIDMREQVVDVPPQEVITNDNVVVTVDAVVYYEATIR